jgi:glycosyltransferase involved in cell wall biosynthesis
VIVSVRNNIAKREWPFRLATRLLYPYARRVVAVTKVVEAQLREQFGLTNTVTIYNPLTLAHISAQAAEPLAPSYTWLTDRHPLLISVGRHIHQKAQWHLIRAFTAVRATHPTATLVFLGEGEYRPKLEALTSACELTDSVHFLGKHENVYQFLARADLFVFSSLWEGMPNTVLEAYAVGVPIVSVDSASGPREIIAPEAPITEPITYPYITPIGTLTPLPTGEAIWAPPAAAPLTPAETALATAITNTLCHLPPKHQLAATDPRFDLATIVREWENVI